MRSGLRRLNSLLALFGFDPMRAASTLRGLPHYLRDRRTLKRQQAVSSVSFPMGKAYPCLEDRFSASGTASGHYFHQDLLVARRIHLRNPKVHVDVGSRVDGFVAHVASFREIEVFDIREPAGEIPNVRFTLRDLMQEIEDEWHGYCDSLSCLHALEHFGLGRFGDPVTFEGHLIALDNLHKLLVVGGKFYLSVPMGRQRIEFNAHRVFSLDHLLSILMPAYRIDSFSFVDDSGLLYENVVLDEKRIAENYGCHFGCAILEMTKLP